MPGKATDAEIIKLCERIDRKAVDAYRRLAELAKSDDLRQFWTSMAAKDNGHIGYWRTLLTLAEQGALPEIFDNPPKIEKELRSVEHRVDGLLEDSDRVGSREAAILLAYRLEFYMMHTAFGTLMHLSGAVSPDSPETEYAEHVPRFLEAVNRFGSKTPELQLIGEVIRSLWKENRELVVRNNRDALTGVLNRRGFFTTIVPLAHLAKRRGDTVGVIMMDLDDFKTINDTLGHQAGDRALLEVAKAITARVRKSDVVGRYGGDEFLIFLPAVDGKSLRHVGEQLQVAIREATSSENTVAVSLGATYGVLGHDIEKELDDMIARADAAMYDAKRTGKDRVVVTSPDDLPGSPKSAGG